MKIYTFWKNRIFRFANPEVPVSADAAAEICSAESDSAKTGCSGLINRKFRFSRGFGQIGKNSDGRVLGLEDSPSMFISGPWSYS